MKDACDLYMLDTNTVSQIIKGKPRVVEANLLKVPIERVCVSSITQAELLFGVAKMPGAKKLPVLIKDFLLRVEIMDWGSKAAAEYATLRFFCENNGTPLGSMDMLIAAHSIAVGACLVTNDKAFYRIGAEKLNVVNWTV